MVCKKIWLDFCFSSIARKQLAQHKTEYHQLTVTNGFSIFKIKENTFQVMSIGTKCNEGWPLIQNIVAIIRSHLPVKGVLPCRMGELQVERASNFQFYAERSRHNQPAQKWAADLLPQRLVSPP